MMKMTRGSTSHSDFQPLAKMLKVFCSTYSWCSPHSDDCNTTTTMTTMTTTMTTMTTTMTTMTTTMTTMTTTITTITTTCPQPQCNHDLNNNNHNATTTTTQQQQR